jgi:hypothetical protein
MQTSDSAPWREVDESQLEQGDLVLQCVVPEMPADFNPDESGGSDHRFTGHVYDLIIVTQTCDLVQTKTPFVATCPFTTISQYEDDHSGHKKPDWNSVKKGRVYGLYVLPILPNTGDELVVDFRLVFSVPRPYLEKRAATSGRRFRLQSPYREAFSRAFGDLFSRVATP